MEHHLATLEVEFGLNSADREALFVISTSGEALTGHVDERRHALFWEPPECFQLRQQLVHKLKPDANGKTQKKLSYLDKAKYLNDLETAWVRFIAIWCTCDRLTLHLAGESGGASP